MLLKKLQLWIFCNFFLLILVNGKSSWKTKRKFWERKYNSKHAENREYDFIIVGAGPAGCILANRLSQNSQWKILLIETGHFETSIARVPLLVPYFLKSSFNWKFVAEYQPDTCLMTGNQRCVSSQGKAVGGGSVINHMMYSRGHKKDFNRMKKRGNYGWSWDDVLPYFKKTENVQIPELRTSPYHGTNGDISVDYCHHRSELAETFMEASKSLGFDEVDYNAGHQIGTSFIQTNTLRGQRHSSFRAFIKPILERDNLDIMVATNVTKILIDKQKTAYGVECIRKDKKFTVTATKEVILSAGVYNSPKLLMLSGVGPANELNRIGVPVIHELPVGQTLEYHTCVMGIPFLTNTSGLSLSQDTLNAKVIYDFFAKHKGWLTTPGIEVAVYANTKKEYIKKSDYPDVELIFFPSAFQTIKDNIQPLLTKSTETQSADGFTIMLTILNHKSKGTVTLRDNNPLNPPVINANQFSDHRDMEAFLRGIRLTIKIAESEKFKKYDTVLQKLTLPSCPNEVFNSDEYWKCFVRNFDGTIFHETSTCKMGPASDPTTVVSPELKVHGINRLRVADTSTIPFVTTSHTGANSMLIGEKAAEMIKNDY